MSTNRLIREKSPYLLQHAHNPVDWFPWAEDAFSKARREDKPIFLSIGYSTCHWCHVMEKESFDNPDVAKLLNDVFVCIKVDREERPDIDNLYMTTCQLMTGNGGWPLTIIMTPDKKPFFAATYIPKKDSFGRIGLMNLIPRIDLLWKNQRDNVLKTSNNIVETLEQISKDPHIETLDKSILDTTYRMLEENFDENYGGFGHAPKFPQPHNLFFLLRLWKKKNNRKALEMVEKTLHNMRRGGIFDHIGFGFHRYSTDEQWLLPHFEKMLYDQALLSMVYIETYQATRNKIYGKTARKIFSYVLRDMTSPKGGFYSAEDADSEGEEGKFYLWTYDEIVSILGDEVMLFTKLFNIETEGNYMDESTGKRNYKNILYLKKDFAAYAQDMNITEQELSARIETAQKKLFDIRNKRVYPRKDDKILTSWNGLMIASLAKATQVLDDHKYTVAAQNAAHFILQEMRRNDGRLLHRYRDGEAAITAHLDDYAFFIWGLVELYEATFNVNYLKNALELNEDLIDHYWDKNNGGFYFTPDDGEDLLVREKQSFDRAIPSGNSISLMNLLRLARITANTDYEQMAEKMVSVFANNIKRNPIGHTQFIIGYDFMSGPHYHVVIAGKKDHIETMNLLESLRTHFVPNKIVVFRPTDIHTPDIVSLATYTKNQIELDGKPTAYVCVDFNCKTPTTNAQKMLTLIGEKTNMEEG